MRGHHSSAGAGDFGPDERVLAAQRIVAAAAELMFENGVAETTLEDIRAAAGVSGSQVYHYFEDKQALVRAVIDYQADAVLDAQGAHLDRLDTMAACAPGVTSWSTTSAGSGAGAAAPSAPWAPRWPRPTPRPGSRRPGDCAAGKAGSATGSRP